MINCILVCNFFTAKHYWSGCRSRWENLDCGQYPFQPIKFMNLVAPSPCQTKPYKKAVMFEMNLWFITTIARLKHSCQTFSFESSQLFHCQGNKKTCIWNSYICCTCCPGRLSEFNRLPSLTCSVGQSKELFLIMNSQVHVSWNKIGFD